MITLHDLDEAIMECQGERYPNANTCIKLAAFYTIRQHLFQPTEIVQESLPMDRGYSYDASPKITYTGDSDFAQKVNGRDQLEVMALIDELMETLKAINPRLYAGVMRRFE